MQRRVPSYVLLAIILATSLLLFTSTFGEGADDYASDSTAPSQRTAATTADLEDSVRFLRVGLTGTISAGVRSADLTGDGVTEALLGTSGGLYVLSQGSLVRYIPTSSAVTDIGLLNDVTGDGRSDVAVVVGDTYFPNVRVYDPETGDVVWQFVPRQEVFIENLMWTQQQTTARHPRGEGAYDAGGAIGPTGR